ncbi:MAG TPA: DUF3280 domain-containing protein [Aliidongia sp.]|nr:DUF3280 domain-containing protein [Aliidongia sp.]
MTNHPIRFAALTCALVLWAVPRFASAEAAAIRLAIFDFELEDRSAGASVTEGSAEDEEQLGRVTAKVRELIAQSGRYDLVDVASADAAAVRTHTLRQCNGCDAAIGLKLGAEQSLVGIVSRISRTEYQVAVSIRDTRTGAVIAAAQTGLRIGADYSWDRGAARLIQDRILDN